MKTILFFSSIFLFISCKKDFTCACDTTKTTDEIYYLNKVESEKTTEHTGTTAEAIKATKKKAEQKCSDMNNSYSEANTSLPEGRSGGAYTFDTSCKLL